MRCGDSSAHYTDRCSIFEYFHFEMLRRLREQIPAVEA